MSYYDIFDILKYQTKLNGSDTVLTSKSATSSLLNYLIFSLSIVDNQYIKTTARSFSVNFSFYLGFELFSFFLVSFFLFLAPITFSDVK